MRKVTAERLGQLLFEEFDRDGWGDIEPLYFNPENWPSDADTDRHAGIDKVLARVTKRLNEEK